MTSEQGEAVANRVKNTVNIAGYAECSALTGTGLKEIFTLVRVSAVIPMHDTMLTLPFVNCVLFVSLHSPEIAAANRKCPPLVCWGFPRWCPGCQRCNKSKGSPKRRRQELRHFVSNEQFPWLASSQAPKRYNIFSCVSIYLSQYVCCANRKTSTLQGP